MNPVQFQAQQPQAIHAQVIYPPQQNYSFFTQVLPQLFQMAGAAKQLIEGNPLQDAQVNTERTRNQDYYNRYINESNDPAQRRNRWEQAMAGAKANGDESAIAQLQAMDPTLMDVDQQGRQQQFQETSQLAQWSKEGQGGSISNPGGQTAQSPSNSMVSGTSPQTMEAITTGQPGGAESQPPPGSPPGPSQSQPGGPSLPDSRLGSPTGPPPITSEIPGNPNLPQAPATDPLLHEVSRKTGLPVEYLYKSDHPDNPGYPLVKPEVGAAINAPLAAMVPPPPPGPEDAAIQQAVASVQPSAQQWVRTFSRANMWNKFVTKQPLDDTDLFGLQVGAAQADMFLREAAAKAGYMDQKDFDPQQMLYLAEGLKPNGERGEGFIGAIRYLNTIPPTARKFAVEMAGNLAQYDLNYAKLAEEAYYHQGSIMNAAEANQIRRDDLIEKQQVNDILYGPGGIKDRELAISKQKADAYSKNVNLKTNTYTVTINGQQYTGTKDQLDVQMRAIAENRQSQEATARQQTAVSGMLRSLAGVTNTNVIAAGGRMTAVKFEMKELADARQQAVSLLSKRQSDLDSAYAENLLRPKTGETREQFLKRANENPTIKEINNQIEEYQAKVAAYDEQIGQVPTRGPDGKWTGGTGLRQELWKIQSEVDAASGASGQMGSILAAAADEQIRTGKIGPQTLQLLQATLPKGGQTPTPGGNNQPQAGGGATSSTSWAKGQKWSAGISPGLPVGQFVQLLKKEAPGLTSQEARTLWEEYQKRTGKKVK